MCGSYGRTWDQCIIADLLRPPSLPLSTGEEADPTGTPRLYHWLIVSIMLRIVSTIFMVSTVSSKAVFRVVVNLNNAMKHSTRSLYLYISRRRFVLFCFSNCNRLTSFQLIVCWGIYEIIRHYCTVHN